jgi:hypothetical protein
MPLVSKNEVNCLERNSPPPSDCNYLIQVENCFSTKDLNFIKVTHTSNLRDKGYNHEYLEKSSINIT